jgi:hypothetical protein
MMLSITIKEQPSEVEVGYMLGTAVINDRFFHIECVRVAYDEASGMMLAVDGDDEDNASRLEDLTPILGCSRIANGVKMDGHEGEWVVYITPYGD